MDERSFDREIQLRFGFSLDVISLLVSQFDLQNKKYCIRLQLVVAFGLGIRSVVAPESGVFVQGSIFFLLC